jgi:hypothetical protein
MPASYRRGSQEIRAGRSVVAPSGFETIIGRCHVAQFLPVLGRSRLGTVVVIGRCIEFVLQFCAARHS